MESPLYIPWDFSLQNFLNQFKGKRNSNRRTDIEGDGKAGKGGIAGRCERKGKFNTSAAEE